MIATEGLRTDELDAYARKLEYYKSIGAPHAERDARNWTIAMRTDAATRTDAADRLDDPSLDTPKLVDDRALIEVAVLARQTAPGVVGGPARAQELHRELDGYLLAGRTTLLHKRAEAVLGLHQWSRCDAVDDMSSIPNTLRPSQTAINGWLPPAGTGSYSRITGIGYVRWPDEAGVGDEAAARRKLRDSGIDDAAMDTAAVHAAVTMLLAKDRTDADVTPSERDIALARLELQASAPNARSDAATGFGAERFRVSHEAHVQQRARQIARGRR
jgi:hypothetical protein